MFSRLLEVARDRAGTAMVEFAIVLPLLAIVLLGILQLGIMFYDWVQVENVAAIGLRQFLASRLTSTPYSSATTAIQASTNLPTGQLTITMSVGGTACNSDPACSTALKAANAITSTGVYLEGQMASVTVSYPCLTLLPVSWVAKVCPGGVVLSTFTQRVD